MLIPPTDESIKFLQTRAVDPFPTVYDAGDSSIDIRYTKVWAEYYNKIRNFIGVVQPIAENQTAISGGSVNNLSYWTLNPRPTLQNIIYGSAKLAYDQGKAPPTTIFPFEIVITSSTHDYSNWPKLYGTNPMLYQSSVANMNKIVFGSIPTIKPMVKCTLESDNVSSYETGWSVNSYCIVGNNSTSDTLLIRGSVIDISGSDLFTDQLPPLSHSFPNSQLMRLNVTIVGVTT